jgi:hypothetical protein
MDLDLNPLLLLIPSVSQASEKLMIYFRSAIVSDKGLARERAFGDFIFTQVPKQAKPGDIKFCNKRPLIYRTPQFDERRDPYPQNGMADGGDDFF